MRLHCKWGYKHSIYFKDFFVCSYICVLLIPVSAHVQKMQSVTKNQKICAFDGPAKFM